MSTPGHIPSRFEMLKEDIDSIVRFIAPPSNNQIIEEYYGRTRKITGLYEHRPYTNVATFYPEPDRDRYYPGDRFEYDVVRPTFCSSIGHIDPPIRANVVSSTWDQYYTVSSVAGDFSRTNSDLFKKHSISEKRNGFGKTAVQVNEWKGIDNEEGIEQRRGFRFRLKRKHMAR